MSFAIQIIRYIGMLAGKVYPNVVRQKITKVTNAFYSGIYCASFKKCGKNFYAEYPLKLIGTDFVEIGNNCSFFSGTRIEIFGKVGDQNFNPKVSIGNNVNVINDCHIGCINKISIGDNVLIASRVFITDHFHGNIDENSIKITPAARPLFSRGPVIIEANVWIGEGVAIMPNVTVGKNSIIGANAVVTKSFPPNSVIGGVPAKLLRSL